jgi:hypothetical protein
LDTTNFFVNEIQLNLDKGIDILEQLIENVKSQIPKKIKKQFNNDLEIKSAIICEYIML